MNKLKKLYDRGMRPVYKDSSMITYERVPVAAIYKEGTCKWSHKFADSEPVFFAFIHPYTCEVTRSNHLETKRRHMD